MQFCQAEQDDGFWCRRVRVRGEYCVQFLVVGNNLFPEWIFSTRSFIRTAFFIWTPVDANNRILGGRLTGRVVTDANQLLFDFEIPFTVQQDDTMVEVVIQTIEPIPFSPLNGFIDVDAEGDSEHNLTRFANNCEYDIDCGISYFF